MATRNFHPLSRLQILLCSLHTQWCEFLSKYIHICHLVYWGGGIYGKRSAWTRADGGGELASRRNKKREISRNLFSINLHSWVLLKVLIVSLFGARDGPNSYANSAMALCMPSIAGPSSPEDEPDSRLSFSLGFQINQKPTFAILNTTARHALSNGNTFALK